MAKNFVVEDNGRREVSPESLENTVVVTGTPVLGQVPVSDGIGGWSPGDPTQPPPVTYYQPDLLGAWTNTGVAKTYKGNAVIRVGSTLYQFGGYATSNGAPTKQIWSASVAAPAVWTYTGNDLPYCSNDAANQARVAVIDSTVWVFGGGGNGVPDDTHISCAALSDLSSWTSPGVMPNARYNSAFAVSRDQLIFMCGWDQVGEGVGGAATNNTMIAPVGDPTNMSYGGGVIADAILEAAGCVLGDTFYMFGGDARPTYGYRGSASTGLFRTRFNALFTDVSGCVGVHLPLWHIGSHLWMPVGGTTVVRRIDPIAFSSIDIDAVLPDAMSQVNQPGSWIVDGYLYICGQDGVVYRSSRTKLTGPAQKIGSVAPIQCWTDDGMPVVLTTSVQRGFASWLCNHLTAL